PKARPGGRRGQHSTGPAAGLRSLFRLLKTGRDQARPPRVAALRLCRLGRRAGRRDAVAVGKGPLLVAPGGALGGVDLAVMIGVDAVKALAEAGVAISLRETGEPVVIRLDLREPGLARRRQIAGRQLYRQFAASSLDQIEPPVAILLK